MPRLFISLCACLLLPFMSVASIVVEQTDITGSADYGSGVGQSFILPSGATVAAIQLHVGSTGYNGGGSVNVHLWQADTSEVAQTFGRLGDTPVASGTLDRSEVTTTPAWYTIELDTPFTNNTPDPVYMVFELELLTYGADGWNDYSFSKMLAYSNGHQVYWSTSQQEYINNDHVFDMTFRILDSTDTAALDFEYDVNTEDGYVEITAYVGHSSEIIIPEYIDGFDVRYLRNGMLDQIQHPVTSIYIPATVESFSAASIKTDNNPLQTIIVNENNEAYVSINNVVYSSDMKRLIAFPDAGAGHFEMPESVIQVDEAAFMFCNLLESINLPSDLKFIGDRAFSSCYSLKSIQLPSNLYSIGNKAFRSSGIESITIPSSLRFLGGSAFSFCTSLEEVVINDGLSTIPMAFVGCVKLKTIYIPGSVQSIENYSFHGCSNLKSVVFSGNAPDLIFTPFTDYDDELTIYRPASSVGYDGEDWQYLNIKAYDGPIPDTGFMRYLARQGVVTSTHSSDPLPVGGVPYLAAFAFDIDLSQPIEPQLPGVRLENGEAIYTFYAASEGVDYQIKASKDLADWDSTPVTLGPLSASGHREASVTLTGGEPCFFKATVSSQE